MRISGGLGAAVVFGNEGGERKSCNGAGEQGRAGDGESGSRGEEAQGRGYEPDT